MYWLPKPIRIWILRRKEDRLRRCLAEAKQRVALFQHMAPFPTVQRYEAELQTLQKKHDETSGRLRALVNTKDQARK